MCTFTRKELNDSKRFSGYVHLKFSKSKELRTNIKMSFRFYTIFIIKFRFKVNFDFIVESFFS